MQNELTEITLSDLDKKRNQETADKLMKANQNIILLKNKLIDLTKSFTLDIHENNKKIYALCNHNWETDASGFDDLCNIHCTICGLCKDYEKWNRKLDKKL
tara:strand:- start:182 stop:484 length:303 start_codon:yes stop_codon:yes gene_type:complete